MANDTPSPEQAVDLVSAGAVPQTPQPMSMADVLEAMKPSGPGIPPGALMAMHQQAAPNPWMAAASGMAAGGKGNPYLEQTQQNMGGQVSLINTLSQMQHRQQTEAIQRATLMNTLRQQEQAHLDKVRTEQDVLQNKMLEQMEASPSLDTRKAAADLRAKQLAKKGIQGFTPDILLKQMELGAEQLKEMRVMAGMMNPDGSPQFTDAEIAEQFPALKQPGMQSLIGHTRKMMNDPQAMANLGMKSQAEIKAAQAKYGAEFVSEGLKKWQAENPQVLAEQLPYVAEYAKLKGKNLTELNISNPQDAAMIAAGQLHADARLKAKEAEKPSEIRAWAELRMKQAMHAIDVQVKNLTMGKTQAEIAEILAKTAKLKEEMANGKVVSGATAELISAADLLKASGAIVTQMRDTPAVRKIIDANLGPAVSKANYLKAATPGEYFGRVPDEVVSLQREIDNMRNYNIKLITGATVGQGDETKRLNSTMPSMSDPPYIFWNKFQGMLADTIRREKTLVDLAIKGDKKAWLAARELKMEMPENAAGAVRGPLAPKARVTLPPGFTLEST